MLLILKHVVKCTIILTILLGCLRREFASYIDRDKDYPNCTAPWQQQMLGAENISGFTNACPIDQIQKLVNKDIKFTKYAATYNDTATGCKSNK